MTRLDFFYVKEQAKMNCLEQLLNSNRFIGAKVTYSDIKFVTINLGISTRVLSTFYEKGMIKF